MWPFGSVGLSDPYPLARSHNSQLSAFRASGISIIVKEGALAFRASHPFVTAQDPLFV